MKVSIRKKGGFQVKSVKKAAAPFAALDFVFMDNEDSSCTVYGTTGGGNLVDITDLATITVSSSDNGIVTVDPPNGMGFGMHAVGPLGQSIVTVVATWNDGSIGPFTFDLPINVVASPVGGVTIVPGTPSVH